MSSAPHVRTSLEELSSVTCTDGWRNVRVRVLVRMSQYDSGTHTAHLQSVAEPDGPHTIQADLSMLEEPPAADVLEVFGEVHVTNGHPYILVKFFRDARSIDPAQYHRATELMQQQFPRLQR